MTACETSVIPLSIWYFNTGASQTVDKNVLKSGWNALYELYQQWLQETSRSEDCETASNIQWDPVIREVHSNGYLFEALTTDTSLILEGERMQHCIAIYADRCREEMVRCFSVYKTSTGEHIGSLAVEETAPGTWEIEDLKGYENVDLDEDVQIAAMSVVTLFEEQHCISRRKRHSISEQLQSGWLTTEIRNRLSTLLEELQEYRPDSWDRKFVEDMTNYHKSLSRKQTDQLIRLLPDDDLAIEF